jgi:hypothetical protein
MRHLLSLLWLLLFFLSDPTPNGHGDEEVRCLPLSSDCSHEGGRIPAKEPLKLHEVVGATP